MGVSGVILAAGTSSRLGRPKQLLTLDDEPIIRIVVRNAVASRLSEVVLVTGNEADAVAKAAGEQGQRTVFNPDFRSGQSSSLKAGLEAIAPDAEAVVFLLGDQPEVGPEVIDALICTFERESPLIMQPVYGTTPSNPVLFGCTLFPELRDITGDEGARSLVKRHAEEVLRVRVADAAPPGDVDTDEDYEALLERWDLRTMRGTT